MIDLGNYIIKDSPIKGLKKISDLIEFDGPVLSHYIDSKNNDYLLYWVDFTTDTNRWILWKATKESLHSYLRKSISLEQVLNESDTYYFIVDTNEIADSVTFYFLIQESLPQQYKPNLNSFFPNEFPSYYLEYFFDFTYINRLRDRSYYFKLAPSGNSFGHTVSLPEAAQFLNNLWQSFQQFSLFDFYDKFKNDIPDYARLRKAVNNIKEFLQPRLCDTRFSSFEIALSVDNLKNPDISESFIEWKNNILEGYRNDVMDYDFNSPEDIAIIKEKFPDEDVRDKIFSPILDIVEDSRIELSINKRDLSFRKTFKPLIKENKAKIVPQKEKVLEKKDRKKLMNIVVELPEDGDISSLTKKAITDGLLFSQETESYPLIISSFKANGYSVEFKDQISATVKLADNDHYTLVFEELDITIELKEKDKIKDHFYSQILYRYNDFVSKKDKSVYNSFFVKNPLIVIPLK